MMSFKNILARILKNNIVFQGYFSRLFCQRLEKIILTTQLVVAVRGGVVGDDEPIDGFDKRLQNIRKRHRKPSKRYR